MDRETIEQSADRARALIDICDSFDDTLIEDYNDDIPKLSIPASKEQCMDALHALNASYADEERYERHLEVRRCVERGLLVYLMWVDSIVPEEEVEEDDGPVTEEAIMERVRKLAFREPAGEVQAWLEKDVELQLAENEQANFYSMIEGQDKELQRWISLEANPYSRHLDRRKSTRKPVELVTNGTASVPLEIASLIMSHCSLEACVALRQASSFWYSLYQQSSHMLEEKIQERNPWIRPEADMTWGDCALVFVHRASKWTLFEELKFTDQKYSPYLLTASVLEHNEKVPSDLDLLENLTLDHICATHLCLEYRGGVNPKTLEAHKDEHLKPEVLRSFDDKTVVRYAGFELTLPPYKGDVIVRLGEHYILVAIRNQVGGGEELFDGFLFSRYKPLHWKYAFKSPEVGGPPGRELGFIYVRGEDIYNLVTGELVDFSEVGKPVAFYNGLVWVMSNSRIFPILFDSGKMYSDGTSIVIRDDSRLRLEQMRGQNARFLTRSTHRYRGCCLIDLETRIVTEIENPVVKIRRYNRLDYARELFFPGYVGDRFHVWCMDYDTIKKYEKEMRERAHGMIF